MLVFNAGDNLCHDLRVAFNRYRKLREPPIMFRFHDAEENTPVGREYNREFLEALSCLGLFFTMIDTLTPAGMLMENHKFESIDCGTLAYSLNIFYPSNDEGGDWSPANFIPVMQYFFGKFMEAPAIPEVYKRFIESVRVEGMNILDIVLSDEGIEAKHEKLLTWEYGLTYPHMLAAINAATKGVDMKDALRMQHVKLKEHANDVEVEDIKGGDEEEDDRAGDHRYYDAGDPSSSDDDGASNDEGFVASEGEGAAESADGSSIADEDI